MGGEMTNGNDLIHADKQTFGSKELGSGLTKRELFAAMVMQGCLTLQANPECSYSDTTTPHLDENGKMLYDENGYPIRDILKSWQSKVAEDAVSLADALIEALNKGAK